MKVKSKRKAEFWAAIIVSLFFILLNSFAAFAFWTFIGMGGLR